MGDSVDKRKSKSKKWINKLMLDFLKINALVFITLWVVTLITSILDLKALLIVMSGNIGVGLIASSLIGGIAMGNPIIGYVLGKEALEAGASVAVVGAFILSWITVGILQIPVESKYFGKKFAIVRNLTGILFSIIFGLLLWLIF
jgi:uncharacterized membrane protein YraQ (UPF0718 family)